MKLMHIYTRTLVKTGDYVTDDDTGYVYQVVRWEEPMPSNKNLGFVFVTEKDSGVAEKFRPVELHLMWTA